MNEFGVKLRNIPIGIALLSVIFATFPGSVWGATSNYDLTLEKAPEGYTFELDSLWLDQDGFGVQSQSLSFEESSPEKTTKNMLESYFLIIGADSAEEFEETLHGDEGFTAAIISISTKIVTDHNTGKTTYERFLSVVILDEGGEHRFGGEATRKRHKDNTITHTATLEGRECSFTIPRKLKSR